MPVRNHAVIGSREAEFANLSGLLALALACLPAVGARADWLPGWTSALTPPLAFAATHWLVPAVRPLREQLVSPKSILYAGFAIQLVAAPLLFVVVGPVLWVFPVPQSWHGVATAALLIGLSFPCWAIGVAAFERRTGSREPGEGWGKVPHWAIILCAVLGLAGLVLYVLETNIWIVSGSQGTDGDGGVVTVLRLLLRPFLAVAGIAILSNVLLERGPPDRRRRFAALAICVVLVVLSYATVDARRAPLLAALLALVSAYALIAGRLSMRTLATLAAGAIMLFFVVRVLRAPGQPFNTIFNGSGAEEGLLSAINTEVQTYAGGLQMVAFLLDHLDALGGYLHGRGQLYTAIAPIPQFGAPVRDSTPGALYNALFINREDQVLPLAGQLYMDFGLLAVVVGCMALGVVTGFLHRAFRRSRTMIEAFVWVMPSAWLAFSIGSSPIGFYQSLVYFSLPSYLLVAFGMARALNRRRLAGSPVP